MKKITYISKSGKQQWKPVLSAAESQRALENDEGFCLACGSVASGVEPDMHKGKCEYCGVNKVYGLEELALIGLVSFA